MFHAFEITSDITGNLQHTHIRRMEVQKRGGPIVVFAVCRRIVESSFSEEASLYYTGPILMVHWIIPIS